MAPVDGAVDRPITWHRAAVAAILLLVLLVGFWPKFEAPGAEMDEGTLLVYPELMQHGKIPYRDFETFYGPANLYILEGAYALFGTNIFVERAVGLLYRLIILLSIFAISQRRGVITAAGSMVIGGLLLLGTELIAFAWMGALAFALSALYVISRWPQHLFRGGLLAGTALLFRLDVGPALVLASLPLIWVKTWADRWRYLGGALVALSPLALLTLVAGPAEILNNLFVFPVLRSNPGRHLPLFSGSPLLAGLFLLYLVATATCLGISFLGLRRNSLKRDARLLLAVTFFSVGLMPQAMQRFDFLHVFFICFLPLALLPFAFGLLAEWLYRAKPGTAFVTLVPIATLLLVSAIVPEWFLRARRDFISAFHPEANSVIFVEHAGRSFGLHNPQDALAVTALLSQLRALSHPKEKLFVGPADLRRTNYCDTYLYHFFPELRAASYFVEMNPFSANRPGSKLSQDIGQADWLILNQRWDDWREPNTSRVYSSDEPNAVIRSQFEPCGRFGSFVLLRHRRG